MATFIPEPSGRWRVRIRRRGHPSISETFASKLEAQAWARKVESEVERGKWRDIGAADTTTLAAGLERYRDEEAPKNKGHKIELANIRMLLEEPLTRQPLSAITKASVEALRDGWTAAGYADGTVNKRLTLLANVYRLAAEKWGMPGLASPVSGTLLKDEGERDRRVSDAEIAALLAASGAKRSPLPRLIVLAVETAMRRGELCAIEWRHVDLDTCVIHLPGSMTKSGKARGVPLSERAVEVLEALPDRTGRVFPVTSHSVSTAFRRAVARARAAHVAERQAAGADPDPAYLADLRFHDLRHEATSRLAPLFAMHELMSITGHETVRMLLRYYKPKPADFAARLRGAPGAARPAPLPMQP